MPELVYICVCFCLSDCSRGCMSCVNVRVHVCVRMSGMVVCVH